MSRTSRLDYAYAVGRVRALENYLVSKPAFAEAAEETDLFSALKIIFDAGRFHQEQIELQDSFQVDEFLNREESDLFSLVTHLSVDKEIEEIVIGVDQPDTALALSQTLAYPFITNYLRHKIDLGNLKILCRAKYLGLPREKIEKLLIGGGFLDPEVLTVNFDLSYGEIADRLRVSAYHSVWILVTDELLERETLVPLEREFADFLMNYLKGAKHIVFGPEPIFAYAMAKKTELKLFRFLAIGKLNQIPIKTLKERLCETYV